MQAAKYLGTPPWELLERPAAWMQWALTALVAENRAQRGAEREQRGANFLAEARTRQLANAAASLRG